MAQLAHAFYIQSARLRNAGAAIYNTLSGCPHACASLREVGAWTDFEAESKIKDCDCPTRTDLILS